MKIRIDHLAKTFGEEGERTQALDDFSLSVAEGEFVCIVGPSGCGKTTLLRILAGLDRPTAGVVEVTPGPDRHQPRNAMVFQEHGLFPWMTVLENASYSLEMRGLSRRERQARVVPFLEMIGLANFANHYPRQLSVGMRQRVSLARAFVADPDILLMDEPFASLDAHNKLILQDELLRIWEGTHKTVLFITHGLDEAIALGDRIVVMTARPGRIKAIVPVEFARPRPVAELRADPRFGALQLAIWRLLEDEVRPERRAQRLR